MDDLHQWPRSMLNGLPDALLSCFKESVRKGITIVSDYSGMMCAEMAMTSLIGGLGNDGLGTMMVKVYYSCDCGRVSQRLMVDHKSSMGAQHVFENILDRVPPSVLTRLQGLQKDCQQRLEVDLEHVNPDKQRQRHKDICLKYGKELVGSSLNVLNKCEFRKEVPCLKHRRVCSALPPRQEGGLLIAVSGSTCKDYANLGRMLTTAGCHIIPFMVWATFTARVIKPDILIHENVRGFDWKLLKDTFGPTYAQASRVFSPYHMGFPANKPRIYSILFNSQNLETLAEFDGKEFEKYMFKDIMVDASVYFYDEPTSEERESIRTLAMERCGRIVRLGHEFDHEDVTLSGPYRARLALYKAQSIDGFLANLAQRPTFNNQTAAFMPTLTCTSIIYNMNLGRLMTIREYLLAIGGP